MVIYSLKSYLSNITRTKIIMHFRPKLPAYFQQKCAVPLLLKRNKKPPEMKNYITEGVVSLMHPE